jgi:hypothetical protein
MKRNALLLLAGLLAAGLIAGGCGDDDDGDDTTEAAALTKEEFVAQGNQICKQGNEELDTAAEDTFGKGQPSEEELESFVTHTLIPNVQGQIDDIRALGIPEGDEDTVNGFLDQAELVLVDLEENPSAIQNGPDPFAEVDPQLREYGLTICAA